MATKRAPKSQGVNQIEESDETRADKFFRRAIADTGSLRKIEQLSNHCVLIMGIESSYLGGKT